MAGGVVGWMMSYLGSAVGGGLDRGTQIVGWVPHPCCLDSITNSSQERPFGPVKSSLPVLLS